MSLPGDASRVAAARRFVRSHLRGHPKLDDAELVTSELVGNAVRHTDTPEIQVTVTRKPDWVRIEVTDTDAVTVPRKHDPMPDAESGYGLIIVDQVASRWGYSDEPMERRTSWAELSDEDDGC